MRRGTIIVSQLRIATVACSIAVLACNVPSFGQLILPQPGLSAEAQCASSPTFAVQPFSSPGHLFGGVNADCELAVGTCHVLTISNRGIRGYSRTGLAGALNKTLFTDLQPPPPGPAGFWLPLEPPTIPVLRDYFIFDPEVHWDFLSGRFWASAVQIDDLDESPLTFLDRWYFAIAVSKTSDPNAVNPDGTPAWWAYRVDITDVAPIVQSSSALRLDAPSLAFDTTKICLTGVEVEDDHAWYALVLDKAPLLNGTAGALASPAAAGRYIDINPGHPGFTSTFIPGPYGALAPKYGPMDGTQFYLIRADDFTDVPLDKISVFAIDQSTSPPAVTSKSLGVAQYRRPTLTAPQPNTAVGITTSNAMSWWSAVYRNGYLWGAHAIRNPAAAEPETARVRWYQIAMNGWPTAGQPSIFRTGELDVALGIHAYLPSIAVDQAGNATVSFSVSGTSKHMSMWYAVKCASDPQFQSPQELKPGLASFNFTHNGDYSGIDPDPGAPTIFYTHNALPRGSVDPATEWESHAMRIDASCGLDTNGDGLTTGADLIAFTTHWVHLDAEADYRADGNVDMLDLTSFQTDLYGPP